MSFSPNQVHSVLYECEDGSKYGVLYGIGDLDYPTRELSILEVKDMESGNLFDEDEREDFIKDNYSEVWDSVFDDIEKLK